MPDGERMITHYVGDTCAGGHTEQEIAARKARSEELYFKATRPIRKGDEPIDLEAALRAARERVVYACIMPDGGGVTGRNAALDQYEALARAVGAAEIMDTVPCPAAHEDVCVRADRLRAEAERLAREVLMHSERKAD